MPSPEEFGGGESSHSVGTAPRTAAGAPDLEALKARARAVRHAQATGTPIPGTGVTMVSQQLAPVPVQPAWTPPPPVAAQPTIDDDLELVRARFKLASYYEALIEQPAFGDDVYADLYAAQVQHELTEWVKGRMMELTGVRNNPEGFLDEEVQLLKSFAQGLGSNGLRALMALAERVLNPTPPPPPPPPPIDVTPAVQPPEEEGNSAGFLVPIAPPPPVQSSPQPPQVAPAKPRRPYVRRARVPGTPVAAQATAPGTPEPAQETSSTPSTPSTPQKRGRKRAADPLAAGRAAVASAVQSEPTNTPATHPTPPAGGSAPGSVQPVPMPRGLSMSMAMEQKAGEALRSARVIETTGGGVL